MAEKERKQREDPSQDADDRRRAPRYHAVKLGSVITRVIGGGEVKLLDFSRSGVLIESDTRLTIGQKATIRLTTTDASVVVRGHVVRSRAVGVSGVSGSIVYQTALALDDDLTALERKMPVPKRESKKEVKNERESGSRLACEPESKAKPMAGGEAEPMAAADDADGPEHAYSIELDTGVGASVDSILEFLATVPHDLAELRRRAAVNNW